MGKKIKEKEQKKRKLSEVEDEYISFSWNDDSTDEDTGDQNTNSQRESENVINSVHPLDLIYVIFLCADDFLRQELSDKMSKCQYAIPFILPTPEEKGDQSKNTILSWGLRTISRTYCVERDTVVTKNFA